MDADQNLLFGVLALQADVLDADQFIKACTLWTTRKEASLADLLIELGWITVADKVAVDPPARAEIAEAPRQSQSRPCGHRRRCTAYARGFAG